MPRPVTSPAVTTPAPITTGAPSVDTTPARPSLPDELLTAAEVAELLRLDVYTVRRYVSRGELVAHRIGRELRIDPVDVRAFLTARRSA